MSENTDELKELEKKIDNLDYRFRRLFDVMYARRLPKESHDIEKHNEVQIEIGAKKASVDEAIAPLIREMNKAGIETVESCEGGEGPAYVCIDLRSLRDITIRDGLLAIRWENTKKENG
jgi:conjugal transfer/entry exclusion protein